MIEFDRNPELTEAFRNLKLSMLDMNEYLSHVLRFMETPLTPEKEHELLTILNAYDIPVEKLEYPADALLENPYFKAISLEKVNTESVRYTKTLIRKRTLMNMNFNTPLGRYLFHYHPIGYFSQDVEMPVLMEGDRVWMSPAVSEIESMRDGIEKGIGHCLTFGLGIGVILYLWLLKDDVKSVTVVEVNKDVIDLFERYILPQFDTRKKLTVINGDAFDYYNQEFIQGFDYVYVDFWESTEDGLPFYTRLMEKKLSHPHMDYWIEDAILADVQYLTALYLSCVYHGQSITEFISGTDMEMKPYAIKINKYFKKNSPDIQTEDELLDLLHDKAILRDILSC